MLVRRLLFAKATDTGSMHGLARHPGLGVPRAPPGYLCQRLFLAFPRCPNGTHKPATNAEFWDAKRSRTVERDEQALAGLAGLGWRTLTVWECELEDLEAVAACSAIPWVRRATAESCSLNLRGQQLSPPWAQ